MREAEGIGSVRLLRIIYAEMRMPTRNLRRLFILLYTLVISWQASLAQSDRHGFYFTHHRTHARIPFQFRSNLIIVPVCLNGRDEAHFIIDTGVSHTIVTDVRIFQHHPFVSSRTIKMTGVGEGNTLLASIAINNSISLGSLRIDHHPLVVLNEDVLNLSEYAGVPIQGIIGYELFANLVVTIDFQRQVLVLNQPETYRYRPAKGKQYPIYVQDYKAYTDALSVADGDQVMPLRMLLDTGAGQALLLDRFRAGAAIPMPAKVVRVSLGRGLNGLINGYLGRLPTVRFGQYTLSNVLVSYPDSADFGRKLTSMVQREGNVGCELLRRFRVTLNYSAGYMVLKPVRSVMREPFKHDMSGLELRARGNQLSHYIIAEVVAHSPAERAGLQVGDELLAINDNPTSTLTMGAICEMLQADEGKPISVIVRRQNQLLVCQFALQRLI